MLANSTKLCYTYDNLSRVTKRTVNNFSNVVLSEESFTYDAAGNVTDAPNSCFAYDTNNRLVVFNGNSVSYDLDGNMLNNGESSFGYDSANRLISADCPLEHSAEREFFPFSAGALFSQKLPYQPVTSAEGAFLRAEFTDRYPVSSA